MLPDGACARGENRIARAACVLGTRPMPTSDERQHCEELRHVDFVSCKCGTGIRCSPMCSVENSESSTHSNSYRVS